LTRCNSALSFVLASSSSTSSIRSASERAVKNLFRRLYSGLAARVSSDSPGDATWYTDLRMSMSSV
jgi:hypothetical protein